MKERRSFLAEVPKRAFHGSLEVSPLLGGMPPADSCGIFSRVAWPLHDSWMSGGPHLDAGIPYANIVWEAIGLRERRIAPDGVPEWARSIRSHGELARRFGILFFTDNEGDAARYGAVHEVDLGDPAIIDVVDDPHVRTHRGWIAILEAGAKVPILPVGRNGPTDPSMKRGSVPGAYVAGRNA